ncbi:NlpC/P60 family protein [Myxococcaceae bacterium GXIMD 01537]
MKLATWVCLLLGVGLAGTEAEAARRSPPRDTPSTLARRAVRRSALWVGLPSLRTVSTTVNDDCSGLTRLAYWRVDLDLFPETTLPGESGVSAIHRKALTLKALREEPRPGDLVFFLETYDRNKDGRRNDGLTHIGVVERVDRDGTVTFVHRAGGGVKRGRLNLRSPDVRRDERGRVLNDYLRRPGGPPAPRLAGQLVAGFASVDEHWKTPPARRASGRRGGPVILP